MQYRYHWCRLTLEILAALHVPRDSEIWIWVLQLKLLSSGETQKITGGYLGPVNSHQTLPTFSASHSRSRRLPNSRGRSWTLTASKQAAWPNNQSTSDLSVLYSLSLGSFLVLLPWLEQSLTVRVIKKANIQARSFSPYSSSWWPWLRTDYRTCSGIK